MVILFFLLAFVTNEAIEHYFSSCTDMSAFDCLLHITDEPESAPEGSVSATGTYNLKGYSVDITMNILLEGGAVTGTVSGTCEGKVSGTFDGRNEGAISGSMNGVCSPFFVNIPSGAEFSGTVNKTSKKVPVSFTGNGGGFTHQGSLTLSY